MALTTEQIKKQMEANSKAWHTADDATKKKLEAENQALGKQIGGTYNEASGTWSDSSGNNLYGTSSSTGTSKKTVSSGSGGKTYTPNGGYTIGSQKGQGIAQNMGIGETYTASDGSVWKKENDGTITVVHKGVTTNNAYKPTDYSILLKQQMDAGVPYQDVEKSLAARLNKALTTEGLGQYAYDDVYDAAWNYILEGRGEASKESSQADLNAWLEDYNQNNARPTYNDKYAGISEQMLNEILNREDFSYDAMNDPLYKQYAAQYQREGDRAMRDTLAEAAASAGGMNTYAITAAQQAANYYNSQLGDKIPELYQLAYQMYLDDKNSMVQDLGLINQMSDSQYNRYRDTMTDWKDDRNFSYGMYQDALAQSNWQTQFDYNSMWDNKVFENENYWNNKNFVNNNNHWQQEFDETVKQNEIGNNQWQQQFDETVKQNEIGNNQWQQSFDAEKEQLGLENSRYDKETAMGEFWSIIEMGVVPSPEVCAAAGYTQEQAKILAQQQLNSMNGTGGTGNSGVIFGTNGVTPPVMPGSTPIVPSGASADAGTGGTTDTTITRYDHISGNYYNSSNEVVGNDGKVRYYADANTNYIFDKDGNVVTYQQYSDPNAVIIFPEMPEGTEGNGYRSSAVTPIPDGNQYDNPYGYGTPTNYVPAVEDGDGTPTNYVAPVVDGNGGGNEDGGWNYSFDEPTWHSNPNAPKEVKAICNELYNTKGKQAALKALKEAWDEGLINGHDYLMWRGQYK